MIAAIAAWWRRRRAASDNTYGCSVCSLSFNTFTKAEYELHLQQFHPVRRFS